MTNNKSQIKKILFVASGNKKGAGVVSSFVQSQFDSLKAEGLDMVLFPIKGKGWRGYLKAVFALRKLVKRERPDIIHAHYSTCGFVASLATMCMTHKPKILVSILGSFPIRNAKWRRVRWAIQHLWDGALTKSERTRGQLGLDLPVIPNGVNLDIFRPMDLAEARKKVGFAPKDKLQTTNHKYIIWCSNPERVEKNWPLAEAAVKQLQITNNKLPISLVPVYNKTPQEVCTYMNAADCLLLTSDSEGSPNVIKEAMACNCPIVTTDVGDVKERLHNLEGCFVAPIGDLSFVIGELAKDLAKTLAFGKRTEGRKRIIEDRLEISQIAKRIIEVYEQI